MAMTLASVTLATLLSFSSAALAGGIAHVPWNQSNIQTLRKFNKAAVARFVSNSTYSALATKSKDIGEFTWSDLAGDGRYELVLTLDVNGRAFFNALLIFWRDSSGTIIYQEVRGWMIRDLGKVIRDLDDDGKDELIIPTDLISYSTAETFTWPAVYRLKNGQYVEASRDFAAFYDNEVLPQLDQQIGAKIKTAAGPQNQEMLAVLIMERDKILRVIARDPTAGLQQAYQWMNSDDPKLLQDAAATFQSIGGHEHDLRAATEAWKNAMQRERVAAHHRS